MRSRCKEREYHRRSGARSGDQCPSGARASEWITKLPRLSASAGETPLENSDEQDATGRGRADYVFHPVNPLRQAQGLELVETAVHPVKILSGYTSS